MLHECQVPFCRRRSDPQVMNLRTIDESANAISRDVHYCASAPLTDGANVFWRALDGSLDLDEDYRPLLKIC